MPPPSRRRSIINHIRDHNHFSIYRALMYMVGYFSAQLIYAFFVLDLRLHVLDSIRWFHVKCYCFARQSFYKNLHYTIGRDKTSKCFFNIPMRYVIYYNIVQ